MGVHWTPDPKQAEGSRVFFGALGSRGRRALLVALVLLIAAIVGAFLYITLFPDAPLHGQPLIFEGERYTMTARVAEIPEGYEVAGTATYAQDISLGDSAIVVDRSEWIGWQLWAKEGADTVFLRQIAPNGKIYQFTRLS